MIIGVPKEIKNNENRVALTPAGCSRDGEKWSYRFYAVNCRDGKWI